MNPLTNEWVQKAEGDHHVTMRLLEDAAPVYDAVCFHAQQCVEKYLKAVLQENEIGFPKTHNLVELARLSALALPEVTLLESALNTLTRSATEVLYPGTFASAQDAAASVDVMTQVRGLARHKLGLEF